jgi:phosphatidylethanolamine-binding protein (PEBP) family uncharacterized protein
MTYINATEGTCATVTQTTKGFVVCFIDTDAPDGIVESRIYQDEKEANRKARYWVHGVLTEGI